jgi:hypothetical protein
MSEHPVRQSGDDEKNFPDTWECRYFVSSSLPPPGFEDDRLRKETRFFNKWDDPRNENDVYFVGADPAVNVKLRKAGKSRPSIKLRVCDKHEPDGFELWHTEFVEKLPAPVEAWSKVIAVLNVQSDIGTLSNCSESNEIETLLAGGNRNPLCIETWKCRWRYSGPQGDVEVAKVTIDSIIGSYYSVSFESRAPDPAGIRAIRDELLTDDLGNPKNYVELLMQLSPR